MKATGTGLLSKDPEIRKRNEERKKERQRERERNGQVNTEPPLLEPLEKPIQPPNHFDPMDDLSKEEEHECIKKALDELKQEHDKVLSLAKSDTKVPFQEFCVASFVGETLRQKTSEMGIKIWGAFESLEVAQDYAKMLNSFEENKYFDIYVMEMYNWVLIPPNPDCMENQEHHDKRLDHLIRSHKAQKMKIKQIFDHRKRKLIENQDINAYKHTLESSSPWFEKDKVYNKDEIKKIYPPEKLPKLEFEAIPEEEELE